MSDLMIIFDSKSYSIKPLTVKASFYSNTSSENMFFLLIDLGVFDLAALGLLRQFLVNLGVCVSTDD